MRSARAGSHALGPMPRGVTDEVYLYGLDAHGDRAAASGVGGVLITTSDGGASGKGR